MLPTLCPVCNCELKQEVHFVGTGDNFMTKACPTGDFYFMSDNGINIDQYEIVIKNQYIFISGSLHKESNSASFTNLIDSSHISIYNSSEFVPFENHKEFIKRILKLKAFL